MSRYAEFVTPENIEVEYELAGIGSRFVAALVDLSVQLAVIVAISIALSYAAAALSLVSLFGGTAPLWAEAVMTLAVFFVIFGYHTLFELWWGGVTPGKKMVRLRVVRDGGYPIDLYSSVVRNLVRMVDLMPPIYGAGLISIFFSAEYKRLGDWAAGTIVVKEPAAELLSARQRRPPSPLVAYFLPLVRNTDRLTRDEFQAVRRFVERRHELAIPIQAHIAMRLAFPLMRKLDLQLQVPVQWHYADLLEAIERRYVEERGVL